MVSNGCVPLVFSTDPSSSTSDTSLSYFTPVRASTRAVTRVSSTDRQLGNVTLDSGKYYMPTAAIHPLFDSFTIDLDPCAVVISVFLITISPMHEGSAEGYPHVRRIMRRVREPLEKTDSSATVKVAYFPVCPDDRSEHQWRMPIGWDKYTETHDRRGDGSCIRIPAPGHYGTSCLFTPNFATD
jgi:hypothetical protein